VVARWDRAVVEAFQPLHWAPADWFFELLSDWWVKSLVIIGVGLIADLLTRRVPGAATLSTASYFAASGSSDLLKRAFERPRPPLVDPAVHPLVAVPDSYSMPSGHASTAFAAAVAVGLVHPRLRWPLLALASLIALSRVWLGVHYLSDVIVGAALGAVIALLASWLAVRAGLVAPSASGLPGGRVERLRR
jgi:membrane-associated phospholipid phosphatase